MEKNYRHAAPCWEYEHRRTDHEDITRGTENLFYLMDIARSVLAEEHDARQ
jgi:hypothetical protein